MRKNPEDFVVLEPKDGALKVGVFSPGAGRVHVRAIHVLPILDQPPDAVGREVKAILKAAGTKSRRAYLIIPRSSLIIRYLTVPSEHPNEIREMLQLGLHQYIPYEAHEVSFDFRVADNRQDGFSKILLLSILEAHIDGHMALAESAGLDVVDVFCSTEAAWRSVVDGEQSQRSVRILVDIDGLSTDVIAYDRNMIKFTRAVGTGVRSREDDVSPEQFISHFVADIKMSVDAFYKEFPEAAVESLVLSGAGAYHEQIASRLERELRLNTAAADIKELPVVWNEGSQMLSEYKEKGVSYLSLVGSALLCLEHTALSFLPAVRRHEKIRKHHERQMITAGIGFFSALTLAAMFFIGNIFLAGSQLARIDEKVRTIGGEARIAEAALEKLEVVAAAYGDKAVVLDMLDALHRQTPDDVILKQLELKDRTKVQIRGLTKRNSTVSEYLSILQDSPRLREVKQLGSQRTSVDREEFFEFTLSAELIRGPV